MEKSNTSVFFKNLYNPVWQGGVIFTLVVLTMLIFKGLHASQNIDIDLLVYWMISGTGVLVFALFSSVISLAIETDMNAYWTRSTGIYALLMIVLGCLAWFLSGYSIGEAGSFRWIFMVLTFGYLLFLSLMRFMKKVVFIAQQEDNRWMGRKK